jgi:hypothetical protein
MVLKCGVEVWCVLGVGGSPPEARPEAALVMVILVVGVVK